VDEAVAEDPRQSKADSEVNGGVDDASAQFVQVLHQAHTGQVGAF
jgi:hypothetical protein